MAKNKFLLVATVTGGNHSICIEEIEAITSMYESENKSCISMKNGNKYYSTESVKDLHEIANN